MIFNRNLVVIVRTKVFLGSMLSAFVISVLATMYIKFDREASWGARYLFSKPNRQPAARVQPLPSCEGCNLVLVSLDTLRADRLNERQMPHLFELARQHIWFREAFTNAYFTTPSHMTLFTSLYPSTHFVESRQILVNREAHERSSDQSRPLDSRFKTLAEVLRERGYATYWRAPIGLKYFAKSDGFQRGFSSLEESPIERSLSSSASSENADFALKKSLEGIFKNNSGSGKRPFMLFLHTFSAHAPYRKPNAQDVKTPSSIVPYGERLLTEFFEKQKDKNQILINQMESSIEENAYRSMVGSRCDSPEKFEDCIMAFKGRDIFWHGIGQYQYGRMLKAQKQLSHASLEAYELPSIEAGYNENIRVVDHQVGTIWSALNDSGALRNTLVVFFSDHGEELLEHGSSGHSTFYEHTARVPLIFVHPKVSWPIYSDQLTSLVDVMPAILEILKIPFPKQVQGVAPWRSSGDFVFGSTLGFEFVRNQDWKLLIDREGGEKLFYLPLDPGEFNNLIDLRLPVVENAHKKLMAARQKWKLEQGFAH